MSSEGPFRKGKKAMFNAGSVMQRTKPDEAAVQGSTKNWDCYAFQCFTLEEWEEWLLTDFEQLPSQEKSQRCCLSQIECHDEAVNMEENSRAQRQGAGGTLRP